MPQQRSPRRLRRRCRRQRSRSPCPRRRHRHRTPCCRLFRHPCPPSRHPSTPSRIRSSICFWLLTGGTNRRRRSSAEGLLATRSKSAETKDGSLVVASLALEQSGHRHRDNLENAAHPSLRTIAQPTILHPLGRQNRAENYARR